MLVWGSYRVSEIFYTMICVFGCSPWHHFSKVTMVFDAFLCRSKNAISSPFPSQYPQKGHFDVYFLLETPCSTATKMKCAQTYNHIRQTANFLNTSFSMQTKMMGLVSYMPWKSFVACFLLSVSCNRLFKRLFKELIGSGCQRQCFKCNLNSDG